MLRFERVETGKERIKKQLKLNSVGVKCKTQCGEKKEKMNGLDGRWHRRRGEVEGGREAGDLL